MTDLSTTIDPKSDQLNGEHLISGPLTITITGVELLASPDQPIAIHYDGEDGHPFKPCKTVRRILVMAWEGKDAGSRYIGRKMTLYRDPNVKFGGLAVGGIRVSHLSHIDRELTMVLSESRANKKPYIIKPLKVETAPKPEPTTAFDPDTWAVMWREKIADPAAEAPKLAHAWASPQNNGRRDKAKRIAPDLEAAVTREVMAAIEVLETQ